MPDVHIGDPQTFGLPARVRDPEAISSMSIVSRFGNYFMNETESDVTILVLDTGGTLIRIPGHRLVIKSGCPKFYEDMIRNTRTERCKDLWHWVSNQKKVVRTKEVRSCLSSPLLTILRFAYTRQIVLEPDFLLEVLRKGCLYLGEDHEFNRKLTTGDEFRQLCKEHAWHYFKFADEKDDTSLKEAVLQIIDENADSLFPKKEFRQLDQKQVEILVKRDSLKIREVDLFNACMDWAAEVCRCQDAAHTSTSGLRLAARLKGSKIFACTSATTESKDTAERLRHVMEPILSDIRFPVMSLEDFAKGAFCSGILTTQEVNDILSVILGKKADIRFNSSPRAFDNTTERPSNPQKTCDNNRVTCKVCLDQDVSLVFVPCGHLVTCNSCAEHLTDCPVCRKRISLKPVTASSALMNISFKFGDPETDFLRKRNVRSSRFQDYFLSEEESDITLTFNDLCFSGHSFVFEERCPAMYNRYDMGREYTATLCEDNDISEDAVMTMLRFIYRGDIVLYAEDLISVLHLADNNGLDNLWHRLTGGKDFAELWNEYPWSFLTYVQEKEERGRDEEGSDDEGSDDEGSDEEGSDEEGSDEESADYEYEDQQSENAYGADWHSDTTDESEGSSDFDDDGTDLDDAFRRKVWSKVEEEAEALLALENFCTLSADIVEKVVDNDNVKVHETSLFNACVKWASDECRNRSWKDIPVNWRKVMRPFIYSFRFTRMSLREFRSGPAASQVLHLCETRQIESAIRSLNFFGTDFNGKERKRPVGSRPVTAPASVNSLPTESVGRRNTCKVCLVEEISVFFRPCGHVAVCQRCSSRMTECPVCRRRIKQRERAFLC